MNTLVPAAPRSFAELEAIPYARPMSQATAVEQVIAAVYRQRYVLYGKESAFYVMVYALGD